MGQVYKFNEKETEEIVQARKENKDKRAESRLKVLEMRARGATGSEIQQPVGFMLRMHLSWQQSIKSTELKQSLVITMAETTET